MATKFFTNAKENTLLEKFKGIFTYQNVHAFDALVGFFRASGYFLVREYLEKIPKVRILVGINVDDLMSEASLKGLEFKFNTEATKVEFLKKLKADIQEAEYKKEVEDGILAFVNGIVEGKIEIKAHPDRNLHAKIYIFRPENWNEHHRGSVITGSSNLSYSGLDKNFEFNVELRDYDDVAFATKTFEELWAEAVEISPQLAEQAKEETYINDNFTPFEIYMKFLMEYFGKSIEYDPESVSDMPKGYASLRYQVDAVNDGYQKMMKHNGFILADVVGLGKTVVATIIAKKFYWSSGPRTKILVIHPPALENNWKKTVRDFAVPNVNFITNGSLHKIKHPEDYDLIIVDEAHKFRSEESEMFNQLQKICKTLRKKPAPDGSLHKKVMLISATPLNNSPKDIRNQIYLFQDARQSSTLEIENLQHFFRELLDRYNQLKKDKNEERVNQGVKEIYETIREKVLKSIIVRRTRTDIESSEEYKTDLDEQGIAFPKINPPKSILYKLDLELDALYDYTFDLMKNTFTGLRYFRYQAIAYLLPEFKKDYKQAEQISEQLAKIMKTLLIKRLESSFHAFKLSLGRFKEATRAMVTMFENDRIYIAPKLKGKVSDFINDDNEEELIRILEETDDPEKIRVFHAEDFTEDFLIGLKQDLKILEQLVERWSTVEQDPKFDEFFSRLQSELLDKEINPKQKLVVFSESKETTQYLKRRLEAEGQERVMAIDSSNANNYTQTIAENFDANLNIAEQKDDYDIILTTEVLAEGVNLHRSNVIVNYDIPWNATRLMQRIGRINRVGSTASFVHIYNFFPTAKSDNDIELNKKAYMKLQGFHTALGEDSQIYSTKEEFESFGLYDKVPEEERDERLAYLMEIRKFREQNPKQFKRIQNMPKRARVGRKDRTRNLSTISYIRNQRRDGFYYLNGRNELEELTFVETAKIFEAKAIEKPYPIHEQHHEQIQLALEAFEKTGAKSAVSKSTTGKIGPNEKNALSFIGMIKKLDFLSEEDKTWLQLAKEAVEKGTFQQLPKKLNKYRKETKTVKSNPTEILEKTLEIIKEYPLQEKTTEIASKTTRKKEPKIIISESFKS
jgi:superfamily II DNA/RNA helicase